MRSSHPPTRLRQPSAIRRGRERSSWNPWRVHRRRICSCEDIVGLHVTIDDALEAWLVSVRNVFRAFSCTGWQSEPTASWHFGKTGTQTTRMDVFQSHEKLPKATTPDHEGILLGAGRLGKMSAMTARMTGHASLQAQRLSDHRVAASCSRFCLCAFITPETPLASQACWAHIATEFCERNLRLCTAKQFSNAKAIQKPISLTSTRARAAISKLS